MQYLESCCRSMLIFLNLAIIQFSGSCLTYSFWGLTVVTILIAFGEIKKSLLHSCRLFEPKIADFVVFLLITNNIPYLFYLVGSSNGRQEINPKQLPYKSFNCSAKNNNAVPQIVYLPLRKLVVVSLGDWTLPLKRRKTARSPLREFIKLQQRFVHISIDSIVA